MSSEFWHGFWVGFFVMFWFARWGYGARVRELEAKYKLGAKDENGF